MKFKLKKYKFFKIKKYIKTINILFFYNQIYLNSKNPILTKKSFKNLKIKHYKIHNNLIIAAIKNSVYLNLKSIINGSVFLIQPNIVKQKLNFEKLKTIKFLILLCIKLNKKIYSILQINNLKYLNFKKIIFALFNNLKTFLGQFSINTLIIKK